MQRSVFTAGVFVSAFLLFLVQPMAGKMLLPHFGGIPAVWNTAMVFFQLSLLAGYLYVHIGGRLLSSRRHAILHGVLLLAALAFLPLQVTPETAAGTVEQPTLKVLGVLGRSLALPFICLSATAPLLQKWYSETDAPEAEDPYFLYAASNAGSLMALVAYPLLIEAWTSVETQSWGWSAGFLGAIGLIVACTVLLWRHGLPAGELAARQEDEPAPEPIDAASGAPDWGNRARWVLFAFIPSSLMLGVTTYLTSDIAAVPLLWVIPFIIYLGTYILAFSDRVSVPRGPLVRATPFLMIPLIFFMAQGFRVTGSAWLIGAVHLVAFAALAMVFHGEMARRRPAAAYLTEYYLWLSLGGALGGIFNALVAPVAFDWSLEYPLVLVLAAVALPPEPLEVLDFDRRTLLHYVLPAFLATTLFAWLLDPSFGFLFVAVVGVFAFFASVYLVSHRYRRLFGLVFAIAVGGAVSMGMYSLEHRERERNFFGQNTVVDSDGVRYLINGTIIHGAQYLDEARRDVPIPYYVKPGPVADVFAEVNARTRTQPVGIIGLGTGGLATYARQGQPFTFYEIDPAVARIAREQFFYLEDSAGEVDIELGDGRLLLRQAPEDHFGLIIVDAFSGDAIPAHLATVEAVRLYFERLRPNGLLLMHISNKYLQLDPVLANIAQRLGLEARGITFMPEDVPSLKGVFAQGTMWVAMARREAQLGAIAGEESEWQKLKARPDLPTWTDDYTNVMRLLR